MARSLPVRLVRRGLRHVRAAAHGTTQALQRLPLTARSRAIGRARRAAARRARRSAPPAPAQTTRATAGAVEVFERREVVGWVQTPAGSPPVRVSMFIEDEEVHGTWAAGPSERAGTGDVREFRIALYDLWQFARRSDRVSVRANGQPLPIVNRGYYYHPRGNGRYGLARLRAQRSRGFVFGQGGRLQLSKTKDFAWQVNVIGIYNRIRAVLKESFGYDAFLVYGSLLGAVREGGFIGHDLDFDCGYVSRARTGQDAARELTEMARALIDHGFYVESRTITLHIEDAASHGVRVDLFHLFFDEDGLLQFPFGVAGTTDVKIDDWQGTKEVALAGSTVLLPVNDEQMAEYIYGSTWRTPNPGFNWKRDRTKRAHDARIPVELGAQVYWSNFYRHTAFDQPSAFFAVVNALPDRPGLVVDLGCGEGRDSIAFARAGCRVLGVDIAPRAVARARGNARRVGKVRFEECDFADPGALRAAVETLHRPPGTPVLFYARFVLHAVDDAAQAGLLAGLGELAESGDVLALEFRTTRDELRPKAYPRPARRYLDPEPLAAQLAQAYDFTVVLEQAGTGFSPYRDEDPFLCRLVARRG